MKSKKNIVLIGMMGSGKSVIGKILAKKVKLQFIDIDAKIEIIVFESLTCVHCANFHEEIYPQLKKNFIDKALVMSIIRQESRFDQRGKSPASAQGLMQILPSTAAFIMKNRSYRFIR